MAISPTGRYSHRLEARVISDRIDVELLSNWQATSVAGRTDRFALVLLQENGPRSTTWALEACVGGGEESGRAASDKPHAFAMPHEDS